MFDHRVLNVLLVAVNGFGVLVATLALIVGPAPRFAGTAVKH